MKYIFLFNIRVGYFVQAFFYHILFSIKEFWVLVVVFISLRNYNIILTSLLMNSKLLFNYKKKKAASLMQAFFFHVLFFTWWAAFSYFFLLPCYGSLSQHLFLFPWPLSLSDWIFVWSWMWQTGRFGRWPFITLVQRLSGVREWGRNEKSDDGDWRVA